MRPLNLDPLLQFTREIAKRSVRTRTGTTASRIRELYDDSQNYVWCVDVRLPGQEEVLRNVPIATSNRDIFYAETGRAVELTLAGDNKWVVTGLAKAIPGLTKLIAMSFDEDLVRVLSTTITGYIVRPLTFGELGDLAPDGFGQFPWGARGRFDYQGNFIELVE
jgi:hypothetical protein